MFNKNIIRAVVIMFAIAAVFAFIFWKYSSFFSLIFILHGINLYLLLASFIAYSVLSVLRALRYSQISPVKSTFENLIISSIHIFINNILPAEIGELAYPYLLKKLHNISYSTSLSDLSLVRIFDGFNIILVLISSYIFVFWHVALLICILFILIGELLIVLGYIAILRHLRPYMSTATGKPTTLVRKTIYFIKNMIYRQSERSFRKLVYVQLVSLLITLSMFFSSFLLMQALHLDVPFFIFIIGWGFSMVAGSLPVQGFFGLGTIDAGWTISFLYAGLSSSQALAISVDYHVVGFFYSAVFGCGALLYISFRKKIVV